MSTGNLRIIRSEDVRSGIADYYVSAERRSQWQPVWRDYQLDMSKLVPMFIGTRLRSAVELEEGSDKPDWWKSYQQVTDDDANQILRRLIDSPDAVPIIENMFRVQALNHAYSTRMKRDAEALIILVENYR